MLGGSKFITIVTKKNRNHISREEQNQPNPFNSGVPEIFFRRKTNTDNLKVLRKAILICRQIRAMKTDLLRWNQEIV
ncbi:hypothetical protein [Neobacillus niacini]|uniref:hypothetical protein n=1 Tax=Neobacillus niacini TaxID=86668 RepID=UPI0005EDEF39|nr:hypothetical protein [Neobacillus niacini]